MVATQVFMIGRRPPLIILTVSSVAGVPKAELKEETHP